MSENDSIHTQPAANADDCEALRALIPAYSLGALDADERAFVERTLAQCPEARAELREYQAMSEALLFSAPSSEPAPDVKNRLLAALAPAQAEAVMPAQPTVIRAPLRLSNPRRYVALLVASLALLIVTNVLWLIEVNRLNNAQTFLNARVDEQARIIRAIGGSEDSRVELASTHEDPARVSITWWTGPEEHTWVAVLQAWDLPPLEPDMNYQLWMRRGDQRMSGGVFTVNAAGDGVYIFTTSEPLGTFEGMGITPEPAGGSPSPTGSAVVSAQF